MATSGRDLNFEATELRLGLPGTKLEPETKLKNNKRSLMLDANEESQYNEKSFLLLHAHAEKSDQETSPPSKIQVFGWPPVRSYWKNCFQAKKAETEAAGLYVKVSMDGAPYLRKIDLKIYKNYTELLRALEEMFNFKLGGYCVREGYNGPEHAPTYEDKDGDCMLLGDVPWDMFIDSCKRLRIVKGSEAKRPG